MLHKPKSNVNVKTGMKNKRLILTICWFIGAGIVGFTAGQLDVYYPVIFGFWFYVLCLPYLFSLFLLKEE